MEPAGNPGIIPPRFRRYFLRGIAWLAIAPVLFFLLSNLWLATPWGRSWVAGKISVRIGLDAGLQRAAWAPWSGIRLQGLSVAQPSQLQSNVTEPLFRAESIRLWPEWKAWLKKKPEIRSIEIEQPRMVVPLQLLSHFAPRQPQPPALPAVAANESAAPQPPAIGPRPPGENPAPAAAPPEAPPSAQPPVALTPEPPATPVATAPPATTGPPPPTAWIHIRQGSVALVSKGTDQILLEGRGFDADLPLAGGPATSSACMSALDLLGNRIMTGVQVPIQWQAPVLSIGPSEQDLAGIKVRGVAKIGLLAGLPAQIQIEGPLQKNLAWDWPNDRSARLDEFRTAFRFEGLLNTPASWQADLVAETQKATLQSRGRTWIFDRAGMVASLRKGILSSPDARVIGDSLSLLGNATLLPDGRGAAVLRIVSDPTVSGAIIAHFKSLGLPVTFSPLGTPDRLAVDLTLYTYPDGELVLLIGNGGPWLDTANTIGLIKALSGASP